MGGLETRGNMYWIGNNCAGVSLFLFPFLPFERKISSVSKFCLYIGINIPKLGRKKLFSL